MSLVAGPGMAVRYMDRESAPQNAPSAHAHSNILETDRPAPRRPDFFRAPPRRAAQARGRERRA